MNRRKKLAETFFVRAVVHFAGGGAALLGISTLIGWHLHIPRLIQMGPSFAPMQYNTALCFVLCGVALVLVARRKTLIAAWLGGAAGLIGLVTLIQYVFGVSLGIDQWLMQAYITVRTSHPGRMSPNSAICFMLTSAAMLASRRAMITSKWCVVGVLGSIILGVGMLSFLGYAAGFSTAYGWEHVTRMAVHTSLGFTLLGLGLLVQAMRGEALVDNEDSHWHAGAAAIGILIVTLGLCQALLGAEDNAMRCDTEHLKHSIAPWFVLLLGTGTALAMAFSILNAHRAKRLSRELGNIIDVASVAMFIVDAEGRITKINPEAVRLFGHEADEILGQEVEILVPASAREKHVAHRAAFAHEPSRRRMGAGRDLYGLHKDGHAVPMQVGLNPIMIEGKEHVLVVAVDISERKQIEKELEASAEELKRSNTELEQFAYIASHDLQEPLRTIISFMQILEESYKGKLDANAEQYIAFSVDAAKRMRALIQDLLAFSRVGTAPKKQDMIRADNALDIALENLLVSLKDSGGQVTRSELPEIIADQTQLVQLFQNLVGNALKFCREVPPHVHVAAEKKESLWIFSVKDNGIGFEMKYAERIFQVFQRLHDRSKYTGSGIGLAITKKIVERHGGEMWVESEPGHGTTFFFSWPVVLPTRTSDKA